MNLISPQSAFGIDQTYPSTLEKQFGNIATTKLIHGDSVLILNQTTQKLAYEIGENITVNTELVNVGNKTVEIVHCEPWIALEIKDHIGNEIWPNSQMACIPEFYGKQTLQPGEHISVPPWVVSMLPPKVYASGNYTVLSVAVFAFGTQVNSLSSAEHLWSKPLRITILPEKIPEFPFAVSILLASFVSVIVSYRIRIRK